MRQSVRRWHDARVVATRTDELVTPALLVDADAFDQNISLMATALPGPRLRPHVKAHKSTALAKRQLAAGHHAFTCATIREVEGMAAAGLGEDILLANEVLDASRLGKLDARVTVAVDSLQTIEAAAKGGVKEVLIDVNVGLPRCGCTPDNAGTLAKIARSKGLEVRGVMGYEGHAVGLEDRSLRQGLTAEAMALLLQAHADVGGEVISAGGTGTFDINTWANEIQAGSYALMDTHYAKLGLPFKQALSVLATVISTSASGYAVANCGLKALGMDHGNPDVEGGGIVMIVSDEHITFAPEKPVTVGDRVRFIPAHVDPTVAYHDRMHVVRDGEVLDTWEVDLRGW
ncbi:MAG: metal-activated pyridoxal enzyme [Actinobacteria bacterium 13_1_40CM_4_65_12]|nr:MAG: metal-activated pyridoxal enzyme [Actinobacteria bacterium 13_1_40CM_4_65_12]